jgi:hypothetical protein
VDGPSLDAVLAPIIARERRVLTPGGTLGRERGRES